MAQTVLTGSRCDIEIEGKNGPIRIGWGTDVRVDIRQQNLPIEAMGYPHPLSIEPVGVMVDVSVGVVRILENDPINMGLIANLGGDDPASFVNFPELTIKVWAKYVGGERLVCVVYGAKPAQFGLTVQGRSFIAQNMTFQGRAIQWTSEIG